MNKVSDTCGNCSLKVAAQCDLYLQSKCDLDLGDMGLGVSHGMYSHYGGIC